MAYEVRAVTTEDERAALYRLAVQTFDSARQCTPTRDYPTREELTAAHRVFAAYTPEDGKLVAFCTCTERGQGAWMFGFPQHFYKAGVELMRAVKKEFGDCWAYSSNDQLRAKLAEASNGEIEDRDSHLRWVGD